MNKKNVCIVQFVLSGIFAVIGVYLADGFLTAWKDIDISGAIFWQSLFICSVAVYVFLDALYKWPE